MCPKTTVPLQRISSTRLSRNFSGACLLALGLALSLSSAKAQDDYFRDLESPREIAPVVQLNPQQDTHYNLAVGPVRVNVAAGVGVEFNDNVNLSDHDRQSDIIFRPSLDIDTIWQATEMNTLRFSLGLSYAKYFDHTQYDSRGLLISPNSEVAASILVGQVNITLRDRFSYQEDPYAIPTISNTAEFRRYENLAGIQADWDVNDNVHLTVGYNHYNLWVIGNEFEEASHSIDTVFVRPSVKIAPTVTLGLDASGSYIQYDEDIFNNGWSNLVGPYVDWAVSDSTRLYVEGGYQDFIDEGGGQIGEVGDDNSWYVKGAIDNRLTDNFNQRLSVSRTIEAGYTSQYYELLHVEYAADWKLTPDLVFDPVLFYEHYTASGGVTETGDRFGTDLGLRYILTPSVTLGADYRFILNNSNTPDTDYYQNLVLLSLFYNF
jgi:hypothetical protein